MKPAHRTLPPELAVEFERLLDDWQQDDKTARLWSGDASLWSGQDEADWLGWLDVPGRSLDELDMLTAFAEEIRDAGIAHIVLLGMGGSSMAPEVFAETFGSAAGYPELKVLDSTHPAQILDVQAAIDPARTLFIVSSKSGSSLEPNVLMDYFHALVSEAVGVDAAGSHFIAITDPGTVLENVAAERGFRRVFHGEPAIGGRFSALSHFGMVPAALIGVDCRRLLASAMDMARACAPESPPEDNPGVLLGIFLAAGALHGHDKLTLCLSPQLASIGAWQEQLVAESTGKAGKGIIPVDGEDLAAPHAYGSDRVFVHLRLADDPDAAQDDAVTELAAAGQPVMQLDLDGAHDLGGAIFCFEIATAVAGALLGINPFDQPDVEASKVEARKITAAMEAGEPLPAPVALAEDDGLALYADPANAAALREASGDDDTVAGLLRAHLAWLEAGDYCALLAYLNRNAAIGAHLHALRQQILKATGVATCVGFGPRFLHSTGQAYKGGPNTGVFLQLTADPVTDLPVPGRSSSFGTILAAQAGGDFEVMAARRRRILRIHLGTDAGAGLARLTEIIASIGR